MIWVDSYVRVCCNCFVIVNNLSGGERLVFRVYFLIINRINIYFFVLIYGFIKFLGSEFKFFE